MLYSTQTHSISDADRQEYRSQLIATIAAHDEAELRRAGAAVDWEPTHVAAYTEAADRLAGLLRGVGMDAQIRYLQCGWQMDQVVHHYAQSISQSLETALWAYQALSEAGKPANEALYPLDQTLTAVRPALEAALYSILGVEQVEQGSAKPDSDLQDNQEDEGE